MSYSAVVLDEKSRFKLIDWAHEKFPKIKAEGWEIKCHHMTIKMGELPSYLEHDLNSAQTLEVSGYGSDDKVIAVRVSGYFAVNDVPNITIAVNKSNGGKPTMSNKLTKWQALINSFNLKGTVEMVQ